MICLNLDNDYHFGQELPREKLLTICYLLSLRMTISIIGSGKVGASIALNCAIRDLDDVLLVDIVQGLPQGEAMDINHQLSEMGIDRLVHAAATIMPILTILVLWYWLPGWEESLE